jgi:hypothetical protein
MTSSQQEVDDLMHARAHVARSEELVQEQRTRVAELERDGHDATAAKDLLETLEQSLAVMHEHLAIEEKLVRPTG